MCVCEFGVCVCELESNDNSVELLQRKKEGNWHPKHGAPAVALRVWFELGFVCVCACVCGWRACGLVGVVSFQQVSSPGAGEGWVLVR